MAEIFLAGGCFWGAEHFFKLVDGVTDTCVGFANGLTENPSYRDVCDRHTGHAETVRVGYDPSRVTLEELLRLYFRIIDPTSLNRQGGDVGTQYRTGIYYADSADLNVIRGVYDEVAAEYGAPLAVEVLPLIHFYAAEEYHQDYLDKNPAGYCHLSPELFDLAREFHKKK